jgi:hypothetical protein
MLARERTVAKLQKADPYAEISEELTRALDLVRVVYLAVSNKEQRNTWDDDPCPDLLLVAEGMINKARDEANRQATLIWEAAGHG